MAESRRKSRLLREMSRDLNRTIESVASSTGSNHGTVSTDSTMTMSDFNPEKDEAIMSTRQLNDDNISQKLPEIRDTAKKYGRWAPRQHDFVINTSAIGRAFPDFSQGGSSEDDFSIELPRGPKNKNKQRIPSKTEPLTDYSDNIGSSPAVTVGNFQILGTPKRGQAKESILKDALRNNAKNTTPRNDSRKENIPPTNSQYSNSPYVSHASRSLSGERKTLAELHARVADESDNSFIGDDRPATITFQSKNTRFFNANGQNQTRQSSTQQQQTEKSTPQHTPTHRSQTKPQLSHTTNATTPNPTTQSFIIPNMQEMSLNAGTIISGVPVMTQGGRVQSQPHGSTRRYPHDPVDGIEIPDEEDDIYVSLDKMKANVAQLQGEKADSQTQISELQHIIRQLQADKKRLEERRRVDSALGSTDGGSDAGSDGEHSINTKAKTDITSTKRRQDILLKITTVERDNAIKHLADANSNIAQLKAANDEMRHELHTTMIERDSAVKQLSRTTHQIEQSNLNIQHLQDENEELRQENQTLRDHITQFVNEADDSTRVLEEEKNQLRREIRNLTTEKQALTNEKQAWSGEKEALANKLKTAETLKQENDHLRREIEALGFQKESLANQLKTAASTKQGKRGSENLGTSLNELTETSRIANENIELRKKMERQKKVVHSMKRMVSQITENTRDITETQYQSRKTSTAANSGKSKDASKIRTSEPNLAYRAAEKAQEQFEQYKPVSDSQEPNAKSTETYQDHDITIEDRDNETTYDADTTSNTTIHKDIGITNPDGDSFEFSDVGSLDQEAIAEVQEHLRQSRKLKADALAATATADQDDTINTVRSVQPGPSVRFLSGILKNNGTQDLDDFTGRFSIKSAKSVGIEEDLTTKSNASAHQRTQSDPSGKRRTSKRSRSGIEDMTSAFIIPDISFNTQNESAHPTLSTSARQVLDSLCEHDRKNCTICARIASAKTKVNTKKTIVVSKPVPVSERMPADTPYEDEPTLRPSVDPGLALATVIKGLEDEIEHLKADHAKVLAAYNKHDATLGKRQRKALKKHLEDGLAAMDRKSDQLYALYDVLEGQKTSGQEMSEEDVEVTLLGLGITV